MLIKRNAAIGGMLCGLILLQPKVQAFVLQGEKFLVAETREGQQTRIGHVEFTPAGAGQAKIRVRMDHAVMRDHFLSMREFKCLAAALEVTCHVPYPYANPATVSLDNWQWLDHNLLFLYKKPEDFGAKLWNGIIYRWRMTPTGLEGLPQAVDLNLISAPPDRLDQPPYGPADSEPFAPDARWIRKLRIE
ncbi:MAG: hypothetical protein AAB176_10960 [Pseudomonadota bacterium]|jgi:hypothetical protein